MGYREVGLMQVHESVHAIVRNTGVARNTVRRYLREAQRLGLSPGGAAPTDAQLVQLARLGRK